MTSKSNPQFPKRIIRGVSPKGVTFCLPTLKSDQNLALEQAKQHFSISKSLRRKIALQKVKANELEEIWQAGIEEGYHKGRHEGQKQGYEAGREEGFEQGFNQGAEQVRSEVKSVVELINTISKHLIVKKEEIFDQIKPEVMKFSLAICEKILRKELSHSQVFIDLIENLLNQAKEILKDAVVNVFLAPEDIQMIENEVNSLNYDHESFKKIEFIADPLMIRGDCRIETSLGLVNFDINRLLASLEEKILGIKNLEESE